MPLEPSAVAAAEEAVDEHLAVISRVSADAELTEAERGALRRSAGRVRRAVRRAHAYQRAGISWLRTGRIAPSLYVEFDDVLGEHAQRDA
jgi:hypothetical protein